MQIESADEAAEQAIAAGFATTELSVATLLERDVDRIAIQQGIDDWKAGRVHALEDVCRELRIEFGFPLPQ